MEKLKLKNYTTSVSAERSIAEIEKFLTMFGATHIMKEYRGDGRIRILSFRMDEKGYKIPANSEGVANVMFTEITQARREQAERVAWRIIRDWIHSQLSIIASGQAKPDEVLLPYMWDGERTMYEAYKDGTIQIENKPNGNQTNEPTSIPGHTD